MAAGLLATGGAAIGADGGIGSPDPPRITDALCVDRCAGLRDVAVGGKIALYGRDLGGVTAVRFPGRDDSPAEMKPEESTDERVIAEVPEGAADGAPRAIDAYGQTAVSPEEIRIVSEDRVEPTGDFRLQRATADPTEAFFAGRRPSVEFMFAGEQPQDLRVDVLNRKNDRIVKSKVERDVEPFQPVTSTWKGTTDGGKVAPNGEYRFSIAPVSSGVGGGGKAAGFSYHDHKFPIRARHTYGDGIGAPRSGHSHQGQDVFARCGAKLVAARGGRVQTKEYHESAGYYLVIDGKKTRVDYVYMHLKGPSPLREGEKVRTGERIGDVGESGNASGCHLHFELWSGPGWYEGGSFMSSVTRQLKRWDRWS